MTGKKNIVAGISGHVMINTDDRVSWGWDETPPSKSTGDEDLSKITSNPTSQSSSNPPSSPESKKRWLRKKLNILGLSKRKGKGSQDSTESTGSGGSLGDPPPTSHPREY